MGLTLLEHVCSGSTPALNDDEVQRALQGVADVGRLHGGKIEVQLNTARGDASVPLVFVRPDGSEVWVGVNHPLSEPETACEPLAEEADKQFVELVVLDSHTLVHDLPAAWRQLQL